MGRILIYAIPIVITLYALIDALMTPDAQARRLPKLLWLLVIVVIPFAGAVAWLLLGRPRTEPYDRGSGGGGGGGSDRPPAPRLPRAPRAPARSAGAGRRPRVPARAAAGRVGGADASAPRERQRRQEHLSARAQFRPL